ncbi:MAG TPA: response regulator transcription factor [Terriglobales bacterium]|nr:response regulator transcription factor [Terriglobales bacterium]
MAIRLTIIDDHMSFHEDLRRVLAGEPDLELVGEASDAAQGHEQARELKPDVVLMDIKTPGMSSLELARFLARDAPDSRLVLLTSDEDEGYLLQCLEAGAAGYLPKSSPAAKLLEAVREVYQGRKYVSPQVLGKLVEDFRARGRARRGQSLGSPLTPREREVVKMIAEGQSVKEIAAGLGRSIKTIEAHKFNLMRKLGIHNKAALVAYAIENNIVKMKAGA